MASFGDAKRTFVFEMNGAGFFLPPVWCLDLDSIISAEIDSIVFLDLESNCDYWSDNGHI